MKKLFFAVLAAALMMPSFAQADLIVAGRINNGTPDSFTFFALRSLAAGEEFYFTDNGWTGTQFRGASATDGDGNENLIKFTATSTIAAGTLINSTASDPSWSWTTTGLVPGATSGSFANLALSSTGDQIYAFSAAASLPLFNPTAVHFVLDDTNGFEASTSSNTGDFPATGIFAGAAGVSVNFPVSGGIRLINDNVARTAAGWRTYASNTANWEANASLASGNFNISVVPEPTALLMVGMAVAGCVVRRRRNG